MVNSNSQNRLGRASSKRTNSLLLPPVRELIDEVDGRSVKRPRLLPQPTKETVEATFQTSSSATDDVYVKDRYARYGGFYPRIKVDADNLYHGCLWRELQHLDLAQWKCLRWNSLPLKSPYGDKPASRHRTITATNHCVKEQERRERDHFIRTECGVLLSSYLYDLASKNMDEIKKSYGHQILTNQSRGKKDVSKDDMNVAMLFGCLMDSWISEAQCQFDEKHANDATWPSILPYNDPSVTKDSTYNQQLSLKMKLLNHPVNLHTRRLSKPNILTPPNSPETQRDLAD